MPTATYSIRTLRPDHPDFKKKPLPQIPPEIIARMDFSPWVDIAERRMIEKGIFK